MNFRTIQIFFSAVYRLNIGVKSSRTCHEVPYNTTYWDFLILNSNKFEPVNMY